MFARFHLCPPLLLSQIRDARAGKKLSCSNPRSPQAPREAAAGTVSDRSVLSSTFPPPPPPPIAYQHFPPPQPPFFLLHPPTGDQVFLLLPSRACSYFPSQPIASTDLVASLTSLNLDHQGNSTGLCKKRKKSCSTLTRKEWQGPTIEVRAESIFNSQFQISLILIVAVRPVSMLYLFNAVLVK
jgi:hypothetical protein